MLRIKTLVKQRLDETVPMLETITIDSDMMVLLRDELVYQRIPLLKTMQVQRTPVSRILHLAKNLFVFASTTQLSQVENIVRRANDNHHLRTLFVREDINSNWLPQMLYESNVRTLKSMIVYSDFKVPQRILKAWQMGAQNQLIANATYFDDKLLVINCALEEFKLPFDKTIATANIPLKERNLFEIADDGSYIYWPKSDVHIDLDSIRCAIDEAWKERSEAIRIMHDKRYGQVIAFLRKEHKLRQSDITGLSERQVRRIEAGDHTSFDTLKLLADAHGMKLNEYLNNIALLLYDSSKKNSTS